MKIAIGAESDPSEPRVAATPETVKKMIGLGAEVAVEPGAGIKSGILDGDYTAAGATVGTGAVSGADIILMVRRPSPAEPSSSPAPSRWSGLPRPMTCRPRWVI